MFGSSNRTIIQTQTSKTTEKWVTEHKTKFCYAFQSSDLKRRSTVMELGTEEKKHRHGAGNWREEAPSWSWELKRSSTVMELGTEEKQHRHGAGNWREEAPSWSWELKRRSTVMELGTEEKKHRHGAGNWREEAPSWSWELKRRSTVMELGTEEKKHRHGAGNWREEAPSWSWELKRRSTVMELGTEEKQHRHGAGNLKGLEWFWMKEWSLISCHGLFLTSTGIIGEHLLLLNWQMEVSKIIDNMVNCGQCVLFFNVWIYFIS